jgi:molybdate transport system substrate-binding protein
MGMGPLSAQAPPVIAAASDLRFALEEITTRFTAQTGERVRLSFGSSGNFLRQIAQGAPYQVYLSADEGYVLALHKEGFTQDQGTLYAIGRIVIIAPRGSPLGVDAGLKGLAKALKDGTLERFAIANPQHAPYGRAARDALRHSGLWEAIESRLVLGENVSQAAQFAASGSTQGGIIAYSLARAPKLASLGEYALIPANWHGPLRQRMVLLKGAGPTARAFYAFVQTPAAREILQRYGFILPGEPKTVTEATGKGRGSTQGGHGVARPAVGKSPPPGILKAAQGD